MAREKTKDYVAFNCKLDKQAADKLNEICKETGLSKTAAVERAVSAYHAQFIKTGRV